MSKVIRYIISLVSAGLVTSFLTIAIVFASTGGSADETKTIICRVVPFFAEPDESKVCECWYVSGQERIHDFFGKLGCNATSFDLEKLSKLPKCELN